MATTKQTGTYIVCDEHAKTFTVVERTSFTSFTPVDSGKVEQVPGKPSFTTSIDGAPIHLVELREVDGKEFPVRTVFEDETGKKYVSKTFLLEQPPQ